MNNKLPIGRLGKFFSEDDFNFNVDVGMEYLHSDINMVLVLYRVDHDKTDNNSVYAEVGKDEIIFLPPVEINALVRIEDAKNSSYPGTGVRFNEPGNLFASIYIKHLNELGVDINYGDYVGYPDDENTLRFYSVTNDGKVNSSNKNKMFGYKPFYRTISCTIAKDNEFRGI